MGSRVLVNDRCLFRGRSGVSLYLENCLRAWPRDSPLELRGFLTHVALRRHGWPARRGESKKPIALRRLRDLEPPHRRAAHWQRRWLQEAYSLGFAASFRWGKYSAQFEPNHLAVPDLRPCVATVHDLSVLDHPEWHPRDRAQFWKVSLSRSAASTDHWIVPSEFTRERLRALLGIEEARMTVIPEAARPLRDPLPEELASWRQKHRFPSRFILHLGTLEPRKNLTTLLDAYSLLEPGCRRECPLILAGGWGWGGRDFHSLLVGHPVAGEVLITGYVPDAAAALLLSASLAVVVPSHYEGFGLPVLEAMASEIPVICSNAAAFLEVAGDSAEIVATDDREAWALALRRAIEDPGWRARLADAGKKRAARFSWERTARLHAEVFEKITG
jgi:alpha-1,3-rhamnosyl/mannosyltransferase